MRFERKPSLAELNKRNIRNNQKLTSRESSLREAHTIIIIFGKIIKSCCLLIQIEESKRGDAF
jgi:hypothetical protein